MEPLDLKIKAVIGFNGKVASALHFSACGRYTIYPLGSFVVVKNSSTGKEAFLDGHTYEVTCISISHDGTKIASGQSNIPGVKADVIIWDLTTAKSLCDSGKVMVGDDCFLYRLKQHIGKVQDVSFSARDEYVATLGGSDDNAIVIWNTSNGSPICGSPAGPDAAMSVKWLNGRSDRFVSAGAYHIRVWQVDFSLPKLHSMDVKMGTVRRVAISTTITEDDQFAFCGTETGDVLKIKLDRDEIRSFNDPDTKIPSLAGVSKERFSQGVICLNCLVNPETGNYNVLIGAGDGTLAYLNPNLISVKDKRVQVLGGVTSFALHPTVSKLLVGTSQCNQYEISTDLIEMQMKSSCHFGSVNDVAFPEGCPDLVVTSSVGDIRIWNTRSNQELLRIQVPNLECNCCLVTPTGSSVVSGWNDGKIRAFYPETGRMKFVIPDAHSERVTSLVCADNDARSPWRLISGGSEGRVRIWNVTSSHRSLVSSLKEHRGPVNCLKVNKDSTQCISASSDGSCIVWDLERYVRIIAFFEPNLFLSVLYHPDESQILTCGSNHKITYWDSVDGQAIRVVEGGDEIMTSLDIDPEGEFFVSGSEDRLLKIWHYDDGLPVAIGQGHSGVIKSIKISPDQRSIVTVGSTGEIIFWEIPTKGKLRAVLEEDSHK